MDKKFLNKVIDQLVNETRVDYDEKKIWFIFSSTYPYNFSGSIFATIYSSFFSHCQDVYALSPEEVVYVWKKYINIIRDKIKNG